MVGATVDGVKGTEVGTGVGVAVPSPVASIGRGVASVSAEVEERGSGVGDTVGKGDVDAGAVGVGLAAVPSPADSGTTGALVLSTAGLSLSSFVSLSAGGVGSEGCRGDFATSEESEGSARRLLKDVGNVEELDWVVEKFGLVFDAGGLNKLPDVTPFDKSPAIESSADFW